MFNLYNSPPQNLKILQSPLGVSIIVLVPCIQTFIVTVFLTCCNICISRILSQKYLLPIFTIGQYDQRKISNCVDRWATSAIAVNRTIHKVQETEGKHESYIELQTCLEVFYLTRNCRMSQVEIQTYLKGLSPTVYHNSRTQNINSRTALLRIYDSSLNPLGTMCLCSTSAPSITILIQQNYILPAQFSIHYQSTEELCQSSDDVPYFLPSVSRFFVLRLLMGSVSSSSSGPAALEIISLVNVSPESAFS